jgi:outer membrane protein assembly factor BamE (lipoprotein component of BamABCDE complex)
MTYRLFALCLAALSACAVPEQPKPPQPENRLTLGTVQREIRQGMSGAEVAEALGAPNIVTTDERRRETWVYDRMSTDRVAASTGAYGTILIAGVGSSAATASSTQRTLTVIIRFDEGRRVRDFSYRSSSF